MKKGDEMQTIVYSGIFAGLMAIFVTVAIEKWGGVKGGILGTLPITIVPAAIGIYAVDPLSFSKSMLVVPLGMLLNGATLCIWVILPPYLPKTGKLWITLASSLLFWLVAGVLVIQFEPNYTSALVSMVILISLSIIVCFSLKAAPRGRNKVRIPVLLSRGFAAGLAIGFAVWFGSQGHPELAGLASVFPAIFLTTMVSLWISQGETVPRGAAAPMMLGASSVSFFAIGCMILFPRVGVYTGCLIAWILSVVLWSLPMGMWLHRRINHSKFASNGEVLAHR